MRLIAAITLAAATMSASAAGAHPHKSEGGCHLHWDKFDPGRPIQEQMHCLK